MANNKATRENKHSFRLSEEEDQLLKANVKKSRLGKSEYIRKNILNPCDVNEIKKDDARKPPLSNMFMSKEDLLKQKKGVDGAVMAAFVLYKLFFGKKTGKKK